MNRERWDSIQEIFHAALDLAPSERESYVLAASHGDPEICVEVESLLKVDAAASDFLEAPMSPESPFGSLAATPPLEPGVVLCNRFRILRQVGEGGMGHVYEAWDLELGRPVALKAIRPEIANHPESLKRFRREVSLALAITHPNVCRTFDIERDIRIPDPASGNASEIVFLTMEFLEGETLAARLRRAGALPLNEALDIATQIASALDCAHELGIFHRDIKPANVMLVDAAPGAPVGASVQPDGSGAAPRAVITDFGLARQEAVFRLEDRSAISRSGFPAGTLPYMAPEQLAGGTTSAATDIYAFGLVLFEMVTGRRAFASSSPLSGIRDRLAGPPPAPQTIVPDLPDAWRRAIEGCLRTDPEDRYRSAADVVAVLHGGKVPLPRARLSSSRAVAPRLPWPGWNSLTWPRRVLVVAAVVLVAVSLCWGAFRLTKKEDGPKVEPGALVYLPPVKNLTGDKTFDNLTELLQAGLTQSAQINLLDQGRVGDTLQTMTKTPDTAITESIAREIAMRTAAARVIFVTMTGSGGSYSLNVDIQRPDTDPSRYRSHWPKSFSWQSSGTTNANTIPAELLSAIRDTSDWIRQEVGESQNDIGRLNAPPEDVTTGNWRALADFTNAQALLARGRKEDAVASLFDAVRLDPGFARAYAELGDNLVSMGRLEEGYRAYISALSNDSGQRLSHKERDFIKGTFASDTRDYEGALQAFRDYSIFFENDFNGWFYQSTPLDMLDRPEEGLRVSLRADALSPNHNHAAAGEIAYNYMLLGDYGSAQTWIQTMRNSNRPDMADYLDGVNSFLQGNFSQAIESFTRLENSHSLDFRNLGFSLTARVLAEQGRYSEAREVVAKSIAVLNSLANANDLGVLWLDLASIDCRAPRHPLCFDDIHKAIRMNTTPDALLWASAITGSAKKSYSAVEFSEARELLRSMEGSLPSEDVGVIYTLARQRIRGELLLLNNNPRAALSAFRKADALDAPLAPRDYLARGLLAVADAETDSAAASRLQNEALKSYERGALRPATIWRMAWRYPPGFVADQMIAYVSLAKSMHRNNQQFQAVEEMLRQMRGAPGSSPQSHNMPLSKDIHSFSQKTKQQRRFIMASKPSRQNITHQEAFDAIRVLSTLATSIPDAPPGPKLTYGPDTAQGQSPMTPNNAAPGLAIWLFLVTSPTFLSALDDQHDTTTVPVTAMSDATNLSEATVNQILDQYRKKKTLKIPSRVVTYGDALNAVTGLFQAYANTAGYTKTDCPGGPKAIETLATKGAVVEPPAPA